MCLLACRSLTKKRKFCNTGLRRHVGDHEQNDGNGEQTGQSHRTFFSAFMAEMRRNEHATDRQGANETAGQDLTCPANFSILILVSKVD